MINLQETRQQLDRLSKTALGLLTIALRAPLILIMGCGYVKFGVRRHDLHDHEGILIVNRDYLFEESYDQVRHGDILDFVEEGEPIPFFLHYKRIKVPIHDHNGTNSSGPYEY